MHRVAALLVVLAAACSAGSDAASPRWTDGTVAVVGDSMVFEAGREFARIAAERGWELTIHAIPGTTFADNLPEIEKLRDRRAGAVIVELGTNDVLGDGDFTPAEADDVDAAVDALADVGCVLFVNAGLLEPGNQDVLLRPPWDDYAPGLRAARAFNRHLADAVERGDNIHLFDWYTAYNRNAEWTRDFVHLDADRHDDYAGLVLRAFSDACAAGTTDP